MNYDIYGPHRTAMEKTMAMLVGKIEENSKSESGEKIYEHLLYRIKDDASMREKLRRKGLQETAKNALRAVNDSIGIRIVCLFIDDVYTCVDRIKAIPGCAVVKEKDYIQNAKANGYRSYHIVIDVACDDVDVEGQMPGHFFVEIQLRTIAMDTWAALEHELKYKKNIDNPELIISELHRCANDLAACDVSMQTLRRIIREYK